MHHRFFGTGAQRPHPEDMARLVSYVIALVWGLSFLSFPPRVFHNLLGNVIIFGWMGLTVAGAIMAICGVLSGIDIKLELPGIYLIMVGPVLYFISQVYFTFGDFHDRFALACFVLWHLSVMLPRIVGLETAARRAKKAAKHELEVA